MGQLLIRQLDDASLQRLRTRARSSNTSLEALAREAVHNMAQTTAEEKLAIVRRMQEWSRRVRNTEVPQSLGVDLIRESRDHDH